MCLNHPDLDIGQSCVEFCRGGSSTSNLIELACCVQEVGSRARAEIIHDRARAWRDSVTRGSGCQASFNGRA